MKFSKVYGKVDPDELQQAQRKLSTVFLELATSPNPTSPTCSKLGGDPLIFALMMPIEHVIAPIPTAATDGLRYYWGLRFILDSSFLKLRLTCHHEAFHARLMHPQRIGKRNRKLWNIAVDYIVMGMIFDYLKHHCSKRSSFSSRLSDERAIEIFREAFGNYITFEQLKLKYANPEHKVPGTENWVPEPFDLAATKRKFKIEAELSDEEVAKLRDRELTWKYCFADPNLPNDMKLPERIYDELVKVIPKCGTCGRLGIYHPPGKKEAHDPECPLKGMEGHCDECCSGYDILDFGDTLDTHMDCEVDPEALARRFSNALDMARRNSKPGYIPGGLEEDIAELSKPKIHWQDDFRLTQSAIKMRGSRNDWTRFRSRPMAMGILMPKKRGAGVKIGVLLDTSGSVSPEQAALGLSQLQVLDEQAIGTLTCCDAVPRWSETVQLTSMRADELAKIKMLGRGGTRLAGFFKDYEREIGKRDMLVVITDGELMKDDIEAMIDPKVPIYWLVAGSNEFKPRFGKVFQLDEVQ